MMSAADALRLLIDGVDAGGHRSDLIDPGYSDIDADEHQTDTVRHARDRGAYCRSLADARCCGGRFLRVSRIYENACWLGKRRWNESGPAWGATAGDVWQLSDDRSRGDRKDDVDAVAGAGCSASSR